MIGQDSIYTNKHGASFGTDTQYQYYKHSFRHYNLLPSSKPVISPPTPKKITVDIPGANGVLDYTEALTGDVQYNNRSGVLEYVCVEDRKYWDQVYHKLLQAIHGKNMRVVLDDDPGGYYEGRLTVAQPKYDKTKMFITVNGDFFPYRYDLYSTIEPWVWDTFPFATGVIRYYADIDILTNMDEYMAVNILGSDMPAAPNVILNRGSVKMRYPTEDGNKEVVLSSGNNIANTPDLVIKNGMTTLYFTGMGNVSIEYRSGIL